MQINKIVIRNFGTHKNTEISFDKQVQAIVGSNGVGKSFLIEAVPACIFGVWPSKGNLVDGITKGFIGDAYISIEFELAGLAYKAERKVRVTPKGYTQDAMLYQGAIFKAGPKVSDFDEAIGKILGDSKIFFASAFSSQGNKGDIVEAKPAERKKILTELLDINKFQDKSDVFSAKASSFQTRIDNFESNVKNLESLIQPIDVGQCHFEDIALKEQKVIDKAVYTEIYERNKLELSILLKDEAEQESKLQKQSSLRAEISSIDAKVAQHQIRIKELNSLKDQLPEYIKLEEKRDADILQNDAIRVIEKKNNISREHNAKVMNEINTLAMQFSNKEKDTGRNIQNLKDTVSNLTELAKPLSTGNFSYSECETCRFVASAFKAKKELDAFDLDKKIADIEAEWSDTVKSIKIQESKLKESLMVELENPAVLCIESSYANKINECKVANKEIEMLCTAITELDELKDKKVFSYMEEVKILDVIDYQSLIAEKKNKINGIYDELTNVERQIEQLSEKIIKHQQAVASNDNIYAKINTLKTENEATITEFKKCDYLKKAFGKSGIQALLIDSAIPQLQNISEELVNIATDGRMSIGFSTIKENKDGTNRESLEIICTDQTGSRDISTFSGGEQKILRSIIRLTLAIFQAKQSHKKLETLIVDEAFDALDADNVQALLRIFNYISRDFKRVMFISHSDELLQDFNNKIFLSKSNGVSEVRYGY